MEETLIAIVMVIAMTDAETTASQTGANQSGQSGTTSDNRLGSSSQTDVLHRQRQQIKMEEDFKRISNALDFSVEKSIRYHHRRRAHYDRSHRIIMFLIIISGSAAFGAILKEHSIWFGLFAAILAALDLVTGLSAKARDHHFLHCRFSDLASDIRCNVGGLTAECLSDWKRRRLQIEKDEAPIFWAVEKSCFNEVIDALGSDSTKKQKLSRIEYIFMNWCRFERVR